MNFFFTSLKCESVLDLHYSVNDMIDNLKKQNRKVKESEKEDELQVAAE